MPSQGFNPVIQIVYGYEQDIFRSFEELRPIAGSVYAKADRPISLMKLRLFIS
jgi:hypothetical protein